jgi:flagellar biosynthetic protein FlhB
MAAEQGEKTEKPSGKRIKDARQEGQVVASRDLSMAFGMLASTGALVALSSIVLQRLTGTIVDGMSRLGQTPLRDISPEDLTQIILAGGAVMALTVGPVALAAAAAGVLSSIVQTGFNVAPKALALHWERLSPAAGFSKLAPSKAGIDTLKTIVVGTILAILSWRVGRAAMGEADRLIWTDPLASAGDGWGDLTRLLWQAAFALLSIGIFDYGLQKWRLMQSLKMSKKELQDEAKMEETNPQVKARIRRIQRDMHRRRMMQAVPTATVVLTNPTHFAVALEYNREKSPAPIVVAKGADLVAAKIREIARSHAVPVIENPPLARALFKECEIGDTIPGPLFGAVAEVLAYLIRIKQLVI